MHQPKHGHSDVMLCWNPIRISFLFGEHENRGFRELEFVDQQVLHTLGIIYATFQLVLRPLVRYSADHCPLSPVDRRWLGKRRYSIVRRWRWSCWWWMRMRWSVVVVGISSIRLSRQRRREAPGISDACNGLTEGAPYGPGSRR